MQSLEKSGGIAKVILEGPGYGSMGDSRVARWKYMVRGPHRKMAEPISR